MKGYSMKRSFTAGISLAVASLLMVAALLSGCMGGSAAAVNTEQQANRAYMSQVNEIMDQARGQLGEFVNAVSAGDVVVMRAQAESASRTLSQLSSLQAPDALKDIQQGYVDGTQKLQDALSQYIDLYAQTDGGSYDSAAFQERMGSIQSLYNDGLAALQKADEDAADL